MHSAVKIFRSAGYADTPLGVSTDYKSVLLEYCFFYFFDYFIEIRLFQCTYFPYHVSFNISYQQLTFILRT